MNLLSEDFDQVVGENPLDWDVKDSTNRTRESSKAKKE